MTPAPLLTGTLPGVPGDVAAFTRLISADLAAQTRRFVEVGIQQRHYAGLDLQLDTGSELVTTGFAGASTTRSGSYNANVIRATLTTTEVAVCSTGNRGHVGTFRVWARAYASSTDVRVRLAYQQGAGPFHPNAYQAPITAGAWVELDLGTVTIDEVLAGTQQWLGLINALGAAGDTLDIDYLLLIPAGEGYSKLLAPQTFQTLTSFSGRDEFNQSAGNLAGKQMPAPSGAPGVWAGAGDADDFTVNATEHVAQRTAVSDADVLTGRYGIAGTATFTDTLVQVDYWRDGSSGAWRGGAFARYIDTNNWLALLLDRSSGGDYTLMLVKRVSGTATVIASELLRASTSLLGPFHHDIWYRLRLVADSSGRVVAWYDEAAAHRPSLYFNVFDSDLATGGALASGKVGIYDADTTSLGLPRRFDNFIAAVPTADAVLFSGRQTQLRSDGALRQDSTGTYSGPWPVFGSYPQIEPAGAENRTTRIAVRALRNNPEELPNANVTDAFSVQCVLTPRYLVPR
jgi:hypothetical protein